MPKSRDGCLDFNKSRIHGRQREIKILRESFSRVVDSRKPEIVFLRGSAGSGKSVLAETVKLVVPSGFFFAGKYDEIRSPQPFSAIVDALSTIMNALRNCTDVGAIRNDLQCKIGDDLLYLKQLIPSITTFVDLTLGEAAAVEMKHKNWRFERIKVAFRDFICVLARNDITIALFLDDLQWADVSSLQLLQFVLTDCRLKGLFFVGAYRENAIHTSRQLAIRVRDIQTKSPFLVAVIDVQNLDVDTVNSLIADLFASTPFATKPLASVVHQMTDGNAFHTLQFLRMLEDEQLLYWSADEHSWKWKLHKIKGSVAIEGVVELVRTKIARLPKDAQDLLTVASCFGSSFNYDLVAALISKDREDCDKNCDKNVVRKGLEVASEMAVAKGLLIRRRGQSKCMFTHDKVQQGAYSLIEDKKLRQLMHLRIGRLLRRLHAIPTATREWMFLAFVDQLNRGRALIDDEKERLELAQLNLDAAKRVIAQSSFSSARRYVLCGLDLLDDLNGWVNHYALQLDMQSTLAEILYCFGDMEESVESCDIVMVQAKCIEDKHRVYIVKLDALGSNLRMLDALSFGFEVLRELGEGFPRRPNQFHICLNFVKTSRLLKGRTDQSLLNIPVMTDKSKLFVLDLISAMIEHAYPLNKDYEVSLLCMRVIQLTLKYGLSKHGSRAFSVWAYFQGRFFEFQEASRFANIASTLDERFKNPACEGRTILTNTCFVSHQTMQLQDQLDPFLKAHQYGMEYGDICHAALAAGCYLLTLFLCGRPLSQLVEDAEAFEYQVRRYRQVTGECMILLAHQAALNLMGQSENPTKLSGSVMDQDVYLNSDDSNTVRVQVQTLWLFLLIVSCVYDDLEVAGLADENLWKLKCGVDGSNFYMPAYLMTMSLVSWDVWKTAKQRKFKRQSRSHFKELEQWANKEACNTKHKMILLRAEREGWKAGQQPVSVKVLYDEAIALAKRSGFTHDLALANERAGKFFLRVGEKDQALLYFRRAIIHYGEWEAYGKADQMVQKYFTELNGEEEPPWFQTGCNYKLSKHGNSYTTRESKGSSHYGMGIRRTTTK